MWTLPRIDIESERALLRSDTHREKGESKMTRPTIVMAGMFALALTGAAAAQDKPKMVLKRPAYTDVTDAPAMFREYCAACHGSQGRGDGPAAAALKMVPADLTTISARNGGTFPGTKVRRYIEGLDEIPAHGSREMPIWGQVMRQMSGGDTTVTMRVEALAKYIEGMQR